MIKYFYEVNKVFLNPVSLTIVDWLNENYWWPVLLFLVAIIVIVRILLMQPKTKSDEDGLKYTTDVTSYLGGLENIIRASIDGNRVKFQVREVEAVNIEGFKEIGATGIFISGTNVKMVLPFNAQGIVDKINLDISGGKL
jgi:phosphotransferase system IIB component